MYYALSPGQALQPVLDMAVPGDVITLSAGTYHERVVIRTPGILLEGSPGVMLHGGTPTSGWTPAPEVGGGVYKTTLPFTPWAMTDARGAIWMINGDTMADRDVYGTGGDGFWYLSRPAEGHYSGNIGYTVTSYWHGIGALFGTKGTTTYVRYQYGDDPNTTGLCAAPSGATVCIDNVPDVTLRALTIVGGESQVWATGADAAGTRIEECRLLTGRRRVLIDLGAHDSTIVGCDLFSGSQGFGTYWTGEWDRASSEYDLIVKAHIYNESKFCVGRTTEDDTGIYLNSGPGNRVEACTIHDGVVGVRCEGGDEHYITDNTFRAMSAQSLWLVQGAATAVILRNQFEDAEHAIRIQNMQASVARTYWIGLNTFWQPRPESQSPKHIHTSFEGVDDQVVQSVVEVWCYHNSFAGGGWSLDVGRKTSAINHSCPHFRAVNNLFSSYGLASSGGNAPGVFAYNWVRAAGYPDAEEGNVWGDGTRMWDDVTCPDFLLPNTLIGDEAALGALDLSEPFTVDGVTYDPLPGIERPLEAFGAPPRTPPDPAPEPEPPQPGEGAQYLVTAQVRDLAPGIYAMEVHLVDAGTTARITASTSGPFTVPPDTALTPTVTTPQIHVLPEKPPLATRRR